MGSRQLVANGAERVAARDEDEDETDDEDEEEDDDAEDEDDEEAAEDDLDDDELFSGTGLLSLVPSGASLKLSVRLAELDWESLAAGRSWTRLQRGDRLLRGDTPPNS
jgi:hypothetical protein